MLQLDLEVQNFLFVFLYNSGSILIEFAAFLGACVCSVTHKLALLLQFANIAVLLTAEFLKCLEFLAKPLCLALQLTELYFCCEQLHFSTVQFIVGWLYDCLATNALLLKLLLLSALLLVAGLSF